jgi:carbon storage regulator
MLVLTRRLGETIVIDGNISITVVAVKGGQVRLGITAPRDVHVDRQEIHQLRSAETVPGGSGFKSQSSGDETAGCGVAAGAAGRRS